MTLLNNPGIKMGVDHREFSQHTVAFGCRQVKPSGSVADRQVWAHDGK
jgi:hypothetical protein